MALGVNMQWGYAGLFNIGVMGFVALGGLGAVIVAMPPVPEAWAAGGVRVVSALVLGAATIAAVVLAGAACPAAGSAPGRCWRSSSPASCSTGTLFDPARRGDRGGQPGRHRLSRRSRPADPVAWPVGALLAAGAAWIIGKTALGLRADYLAIATLGIAEIVIARPEERGLAERAASRTWSASPARSPTRSTCRTIPAFVERAAASGSTRSPPRRSPSSCGYTALFLVVLIALLWLAQAALNSPWGRMMRAIRDNEVAAEAMGKDVTRAAPADLRHRLGRLRPRRAR